MRDERARSRPTAVAVRVRWGRGPKGSSLIREQQLAPYAVQCIVRRVRVSVCVAFRASVCSVLYKSARVRLCAPYTLVRRVCVSFFAGTRARVSELRRCARVIFRRSVRFIARRTLHNIRLYGAPNPRTPSGWYDYRLVTV